MAKQTRLTAEQGKKFYDEYLKAKLKRFDADEPLDYTTWKNYVEETLIRESKDVGGANWSNTEIRHVNRIVARSGDTLSRKQNKAFLNNIMEETNRETKQAFLQHYGLDVNMSEAGIKRFLHEHEGAARSFLMGHADDWNQYFNS